LLASITKVLFIVSASLKLEVSLQVVH